MTHNERTEGKHLTLARSFPFLSSVQILDKRRDTILKEVSKYCSIPVPFAPAILNLTLSWLTPPKWPWIRGWDANYCNALTPVDFPLF